MECCDLVSSLTPPLAHGSRSPLEKMMLLAAVRTEDKSRAHQKHKHRWVSSVEIKYQTDDLYIIMYHVITNLLPPWSEPRSSSVQN